MNNIQDFEKEIINSLFVGGHKNYSDYKWYVLSVLSASDISPDHKDAIQQSIVFLESRFEGISCVPENVRNVAQIAGEKLLKNENIPENIVIQKYPISAKVWADLNKKFNIQELQDNTIAYRWWVARVIAREWLDLPHCPNDISHSLKDVDLWAQLWLSHKDTIARYGADSEWINYLPDFTDQEIKKVLFNCDVTMNQLLVTQTDLYITQEAIESLRTSILKPVHMWKNFFGYQSYAINGQVVFHPRQLLRAMKFLIEWKWDIVVVPEHNIKKENLELLQIEKQVLVFVRRIYQKHPSCREEKLFLFAKLLEQWGVIDRIDGFFDYLQYHISQTKFQMTTPVENIQKDAHRRLSKYISIALDNILGSEKGEIWDKYDFSATQDIQIYRPSETDIPDSFLMEEKRFAWVHNI